MHANNHKSENSLELSTQGSESCNRLFLYVLTGLTVLRRHVVQMGRGGKDAIVEAREKAKGKDEVKYEQEQERCRKDQTGRDDGGDIT